MKIKKIIVSALLAGVLGLGSGLMLAGCSGTNSSLEKVHIMNNGCFITCYNYNNNYNKTGKNASNIVRGKSANKYNSIKKYSNNFHSERMDG